MIICVGARLSIIDNNGAKNSKCLCIYKKDVSKSTGIGSLVIVSVFGKVKRGDNKLNNIYKGVLVRSNNLYKLLGGHLIRCDNNAIVLLKQNGDLLGTRVVGLVSSSLKKRGFAKILSVSNYIY